MSIEYDCNAAELQSGQLTGFFEGWPNPPSPETHLRILRGCYRAVIAREMETGRVVGFITAISDGILAAYIPLLEVLPDFRGQGIGRELVRRMLTELSGLYMVDLVCDPPLRSFYEKHGMTSGHAMMLRRYDHQSGVAAT